MFADQVKNTTELSNRSVHFVKRGFGVGFGPSAQDTKRNVKSFVTFHVLCYLKEHVPRNQLMCTSVSHVMSHAHTLSTIC